MDSLLGLPDVGHFMSHSSPSTPGKSPGYKVVRLHFEKGKAGAL